MKLAERLAHFEDRVVVLEKIVTDRGFDIAHQIEALRDQPVRAISKDVTR